MKHASARTYFFSDTYGGRSDNPLAMTDPDALISTDFGARPTTPVHREFDTFGREQMTSHVLRMILKLQDAFHERFAILGSTRARKAEELGTGVFINSAPRIGKGNAEPFYLATARDGHVRIVTTPLEALSTIRDQIETLFELPNPSPNEHNGLYSGKEQFRSQYTPILLDPDHGIDLVQRDPDIIPKFRTDWHVSYVDCFGNVLTHTPAVEDQWQQIGAQARGNNGEVQLDIGGATESVVARIAESLGQADSGILSIYRNGGIDLASKWEEGQSAQQKLRTSAWMKMGQPSIGDGITLVPATQTADQLQPLSR